MENKFRLEVNTGYGGYGLTDTLSELIEDVESEYGDEVKAEVEKWALNSKEGDEFHKYGMYIKNIGDEVKAEVEKWALNSKEGDEFHKYEYGIYIRSIGE